ncbi:MAG: acetate/propionate family kinase [Gammaproteobacteria bacterium]|uniref:acetate/propionate family kinase n=1 Tax=Rhodoferax sp. TaxID=50421 RepID=UPI0017A82FC8|nr:acetate/propionate family kinase [Rhodoferax sp.]MBU3900022.1 acetate/propionate family kinase [Gammaproteobacteria bacterium]MBA3058962.1 acetate/propionate family kinase [Rhodoferax sp.]MBU3999386.1 acetate/propionate family kinase [Gammaproteobacteria bacterium]MBU4082060.1 acetate/propionate family kinase [Gammaproteobacteria bacterium]MBU4112698.1 acetate/propionate family kinase [Gammaproteobacteria bacterium]
MAILSVNAGSSTLKFSLHPLQDAQVQASVLTGSIQGLEPGGAPVLDWTFQGRAHSRQLPITELDPFDHALQRLGHLLASDPAIPVIEAIAHRVVHGGQDFSASVLVTDAILSQLTDLSSLAPLHQPQNLKGIRAFQKAFPSLPQVACFDTAFHATLPEVDYTFALPQALTRQGVRRYGFHGLSYQYVMGVLLERSELARGRVLMAHLGNGASLCAAQNGLSCSTSMGFSALDGLMMGTRTGSIDPGVLLYLMEQGWDHDRLETLLYKQSGLLGVSGVSADMRRLRADGSAAAKAAIDLFTYRVVRESGAMVACLGGLDVLAFSGGIGEHDTELRAQMGLRLAWLGVVIDPQLNSQATGNEVLAIHAPESRVQVWVVPTDEGLVAAREAVRLI